MENNDSVAFIAKINKIELIEGADKIELATINGWTSVVQKGIHKEGNLVLCITTDAVIPEELSTKWGVIGYLRNKSRVRTVKLKGVYSECILIPIQQINDSTNIFFKSVKEGQDLMKDLNIFKYEPPVKTIQLANGKTRKYKGNPSFEIYYKFPNQKNTPNMFNESDEVVITRKMHGTNARYGIVKKTKLSLLDRIKKLFGNKWVEYEYIYGSHNVEKGSDSQGFYDTDVWQTVAVNYRIKDKLWDYVKEYHTSITLGKGIILYGEIYGPGIQKNYDYGAITLKLESFDVQIDSEYLPDRDFFMTNSLLEICNNVEYLYKGKWSKEEQDKHVFNQFIEGTKIPHEGIVVKCVTGDRRKISKVINPDYLVYGEKHGTTDSH